MILQGKNVLITGATGGLGTSLARAYLEKGCNLFLTGSDDEKLETLRTNLRETYKDTKILCKSCDLRDYMDILLFSKDVKDSLNHIDVLVNCAGIFQIKNLEEIEFNEFNECMQVNVTAPLFLIKEFSKEMVENKWGRVINIASSSAYGASPGTSVYSASKHALLGLSRALYKELKESGVRVLCVSPGTIKTPMGKEVTKLGQDYNTFMDPQEVAEYIVYNTEFDSNLISEEIRLNRTYVQ